MKAHPPAGTYIGLKPSEEKVMRALDGEYMNVSELSRAVDIPNQTLDYMLPSLQARGWLTSRYVGKRKVWSREKREVHSELLNKALRELFVDMSRGALRQKDCDLFRLYEGENELKRLFSNILRHKRFSALQTKHTSAMSVERMKRVYWMDVNKYIRTHAITVDAVVPKSFYVHMAHQSGKELLQSFEGRSANTTLIPDELYTHDVEIVSTKDSVALINWFDETALEIHDTRMTPLLQSIFYLVQAGGKKTNLTQHVREVQKII